MSSTINYFKLLDCDTSSDEDSDVEVENILTNSYTDAKRFTQTVNSEFLNSESANNKKRFLKKRTEYPKYLKHQKVQKARPNNIYDEMYNLPSSLNKAVKMRQNLTLKQILVLMNLHAMPGMVVNSIHDNIQRQVHKTVVKISHNGRVFYVSQYHWYDLKHIEKMIDGMFD